MENKFSAHYDSVENEIKASTVSTYPIFIEKLVFKSQEYVFNQN